MKDTDDIPIPFGKHRDSTPNEIAKTDPAYVMWLHDECVPQRVSRSLYVACSDRVDAQRAARRSR